MQNEDNRRRVAFDIDDSSSNESEEVSERHVHFGESVVEKHDEVNLNNTFNRIPSAEDDGFEEQQSSSSTINSKANIVEGVKNL